MPPAGDVRPLGSPTEFIVFDTSCRLNEVTRPGTRRTESVAKIPSLNSVEVIVLAVEMRPAIPASARTSSVLISGTVTPLSDSFSSILRGWCPR